MANKRAIKREIDARYNPSSALGGLPSYSDVSVVLEAINSEITTYEKIDEEDAKLRVELLTKKRDQLLKQLDTVSNHYW